MTPDEVAAEKFAGTIKASWVRRNIRPKVRLGHRTVLFYERDVDDWIADHRQDEGAA